MASIEVKGYVNKPSTKGSERPFAVFTLAERQMGRDKQPYKVFYNVVDFENTEPPEESSFVTVKGYLNIRKVEKDGKTFWNHDITAKSIEVAPPREGGDAPKTEKKSTSDDFDDLPF